MSPGTEDRAGQRLYYRDGDFPRQPLGGQYRKSGFAVLGVVINAIDAAGSAGAANGLNVSLDAQLVSDIKAIAAAVKGALTRAVAPAK